MNIHKFRIARTAWKAAAIYPSEHDPFLSGNIAKRGVIETISRKAISPLAQGTSVPVSGKSMVQNKLSGRPERYSGQSSPGHLFVYPYLAGVGLPYPKQTYLSERSSL